MRNVLVDEEGENLAVRSFLIQYGCGSSNPKVGQMLSHMNHSGWEGTEPEWVKTCHKDEHLTKAGTQLWLRHLFSLEVK